MFRDICFFSPFQSDFYEFQVFSFILAERLNPFVKMWFEFPGLFPLPLFPEFYFKCDRLKTHIEKLCLEQFFYRSVQI